MTDSTTIAKAQHWLNSNITSEEKEIIQQMMNNSDSTELEDAFYKDLEFGTGGLRGVMGLGSNRMNKYTMGMATQGLANYLIKTYPNEQIKVAVAFDSRINSFEFAQDTAAIFSANNIQVYLFENLRPTPELSFAIRYFRCQSGVVITASHNPKEYNGYKAYWKDGAQLTPPHDENVISEVRAIASIEDIKFDKNDGLITIIGKEVDEAYISEVKKLSLSPEAINNQNDLKIVFSSIHGSGITLVPQCLEDYGFTNINIVEDQATPDGNFPTVIYPNPEEKEALQLALNKAEEIDADLVLATDPDTDRVGIAVKNLKGEFVLLNGNQTGSLLIYYILKRLSETNQLPENGFVVKTIVTTDLINKICEHYNTECFDTLTGFKYIATIIRDLEGKRKYIAGGEESYGYLIGDFVRDKDAVTACAVIAEMTAYAKDQGQSLYEMMMDMYTEHGMYKENLISITKKGKKGSEKIAEMMQQYRTNPPSTINGSPIAYSIDYLIGTKKNHQTGEVEKINFPQSNVLQYITEDGSKISLRPSGTEPKIKFYFSVNASIDSRADIDDVSETMDAKIEAIQKDLGLI